MKVVKIDTAASVLAAGNTKSWKGIRAVKVSMSPAPLALVASVSPYLAKVKGHGVVKELAVKMAHDGNTLSIRLEWLNEQPRNQLRDLDSFTDAVAIMFATRQSTSAITMGAPGDSVNAWFWKADEQAPFDVIAQGYSSSQRRNGAISSLTTHQTCEKSHRVVVFQRQLQVTEKSCINFFPDNEYKIAFAVWAGVNDERSGQKSISGEFVNLTIA